MRCTTMTDRQSPPEQEFSYELKIPRDRVAVLIGGAGKTKRQIERDTKTELDINSSEGDVVIAGKDALFLFTAREIVRAIGRGFAPETALLLLKQDYALEIIALPQYAKTAKDIVRLKGRIIGEEGKARRQLEELTDAQISVYGKTVSIIGPFEALDLAHHAINDLLRGAPHNQVWRWLERRRKELHMQKLTTRKSF